MKIKKNTHRKSFFLVKKTIDFHRIIPPEKVKKNGMKLSQKMMRL